MSNSRAPHPSLPPAVHPAVHRPLSSQPPGRPPAPHAGAPPPVPRPGPLRPRHPLGSGCGGRGPRSHSHGRRARSETRRSAPPGASPEGGGVPVRLLFGDPPSQGGGSPHGTLWIRPKATGKFYYWVPFFGLFFLFPVPISQQVIEGGMSVGGDARATEREPGRRWGRRHAGFVAADGGRKEIQFCQSRRRGEGLKRAQITAKSRSVFPCSRSGFPVGSMGEGKGLTHLPQKVRPLFFFTGFLRFWSYVKIVTGKRSPRCLKCHFENAPGGGEAWPCPRPLQPRGPPPPRRPSRGSPAGVRTLDAGDGK